MINNAISETESAPSWSQPDATPLLEENYGDEKKGHRKVRYCYCFYHIMYTNHMY